MIHTAKLLTAGFASIVISVPLFTSRVAGQGDEIEKRRLLMEQNNDAATKEISKAVKEGNFAEAQVKAKEIMDNMDMLLDLFPKGSISPNSRAKAEIWEKWDEFSADRDKVKNAARELVDAAEAKNATAVDAKLKELGKACTSCHRSFRGPRKS